MVKESDKDASGRYDGTYALSVKHPGGRQQLGNNWYNNCSARTINGNLIIKDSKVTWKTSEDSEAQGYINSEGKFRLEQPLDPDQNAKGTGTVLSDGSITLILQGDLGNDKMKGLLVFGIAQFNKRGCGYPVTYSANAA
jgi:hypothetical protein